MADKRILVCCVSGLIGGAVVRELLSAGDDVRAMVRHPGATANLVQLGAEVVVADFDDSASLVEAHRGVEGQRPAGPDSSGCRPS